MKHYSLSPLKSVALDWNGSACWTAQRCDLCVNIVRRCLKNYFFYTESHWWIDLVKHVVLLNCWNGPVGAICSFSSFFVSYCMVGQSWNFEVLPAVWPVQRFGPSGLLRERGALISSCREDRSFYICQQESLKCASCPSSPSFESCYGLLAVGQILCSLFPPQCSFSSVSNDVCIQSCR